MLAGSWCLIVISAGEEEDRERDLPQHCIGGRGGGGGGGEGGGVFRGRVYCVGKRPYNDLVISWTV